MEGEEMLLEPGFARRLPWRRLMLVPWAVVLGFAAGEALRHPQPLTIVVPILLCLTFAATEWKRRLSERLRHRGLRDLELRLDNTSYLNEFQSLPNRNYMLDQLRREMPRARHVGVPFAVVVIGIPELEAVTARRGEDFANLALRSLARLIERFTRASDFAAELGPGTYGVLLYECTREMAESYVRRVPGTLAVSTGKQMLDIRLVVRMSEYDMESLYAIDVLRDAEESPEVRAPEPMRFGAEAA